MSVWPAPQFAVISQAVLAVTLFRKRLVPAFCSAENFKNLQNCSGHFRNNKLLCPRGSGVSAPLLPAPFFSVATCRNILKDLLRSFSLYLEQFSLIVKLRRGLGKDRQGMALKAKGLKLEPLPRAYIKVGCHPPTTTTRKSQ